MSLRFMNKCVCSLNLGVLYFSILSEERLSPVGLARNGNETVAPQSITIRFAEVVGLSFQL